MEGKGRVYLEILAIAKRKKEDEPFNNSKATTPNKGSRCDSLDKEDWKKVESEKQDQ